MIRFNMPKLRIYQQILICFGLIVTLPLLGVTFLINNINQKAMKKEMARFTEHTAEALYRDFGTEMSWQKQQSHMMSQLMSDQLSAGKTFEPAARQLMALDSELDAVGLYDSQGRLLYARYRVFTDLSPELRLPDNLEILPREKVQSATLQPFEVIYFSTGNPKDSPYYLRAAVPINGKGVNGLSGKALKLKPGVPAYYVQQKNFKYLQSMVRSNNSLYGAFYIIDKNGVIIAGPPNVELQEQISGEDYVQFKKIKPGVTHEFSSLPQSAQNQTAHRKLDPDEAPPLEKVIVKMPDINWGIIIESPYHMKQKYIKWAGAQTFFLIAGCLFFMLLLVLPYILGISRNFRQLIKGVKAMGEGNYYRRIRLLTNFFTPYEIVYLTLEFNRMARKTADSWSAIQEANRKLAEMDEFKSNLIDTVSHELRTPLTIIKGYTSRLIRYDHSLDAETRVKNLKVVKQQADRLSRMVEDLLVIPDLESATLRVYPDRVALAPMLENCVQFIQGKENREITVEINPSLDEESAVLADPDRLEQILLNLLDNAVKYSLPDTPIQVCCFPEPLTDTQTETQETSADSLTDPTTDETTHLIVSVVNICDPLPMENLDGLDSLFDKFKRLDDSLIRTTRGSGLGLFITRGLVEAMGGLITLSHHEARFEARFSIPRLSQSELNDPNTDDVPLSTV